MFVLANLLNDVAFVLDILLTIYLYIVRVRRFLPPLGAIDLSPLVVLLIILFLQRFVVGSLFDLVHRLKYGFGG